MDVVSDVLVSVRLAGAAFFAVDVRAPFVIRSPGADVVARGRMRGRGRALFFHVVTEGSCWVQTCEPGACPVALAAGDMVALPGGDAHVLTSGPGLHPDAAPPLPAPLEGRGLPFTVRSESDAAADRVRVVWGVLGCDTGPFNPLLESLPRVVHAQVSPQTRRWVGTVLDAAVEGVEGAGREAMLARLAEVMFIEALRCHIAALPEDERGWLAALRDPQVGAALLLMHARPAHPWTLPGLAAAVCLSRSSLVQRFTSLVGIPPMHYLARWRLQLAAGMLESGSASVAQVAGAVGYQSEAAFHRAFKRQVGVAPGAWRRACKWAQPPGGSGGRLPSE